MGFSRTETYGYAVIIASLFLVSALFEVKKLHLSDLNDKQVSDVSKIDSLFKLMALNDSKLQVQSPMSLFDPNHVSYDSLVLWGVPARVAKNLISYRKSGGKYRYKKDVRKLYGLNDSIWTRMEKFVNLPSKIPTQSWEKTGSNQMSKINLARRRQVSAFDLNLADTSQLMTIRGIGPVFSKRIIKYRNLLGGFYSKDQLDEVYGLSLPVLLVLKQAVVINSQFKYHKIQLNTFDYQSIARHPYLSFKQAKAIIAYRTAHGPFEKLETLKAIHLITDSTYIKVYPYLDF